MARPQWEDKSVHGVTSTGFRALSPLAHPWGRRPAVDLGKEHQLHFTVSLLKLGVGPQRVVKYYLWCFPECLKYYIIKK